MQRALGTHEITPYGCRNIFTAVQKDSADLRLWHLEHKCMHCRRRFVTYMCAHGRLITLNVPYMALYKALLLAGNSL